MSALAAFGSGAGTGTSSTHASAGLATTTATTATESGGCNLDQLTGAGAAVELAAGASGAAMGHRWRPDRRAERLEPSTSGFRVPSLPPPKVAKSRRKPRSVK